MALLEPGWAALVLPDRGAVTTVAALLVALLLDRAFGEPPARWHPVVWMGRLLEALSPHVLPVGGRVAGPGRDLHSFWRGAAAWMAMACMVVAVASALQLALLHVPQLAAAVCLGVLLKPMLAWRMLCFEVLAVENALAGSLAQGRQRLAWLASREVAGLGESEVRETAIESLAENLNDSVVAPILWFVLLGLPGAALYRFANTADAMWGYRGEYKGRNWEWAGKWAARADDVLSWLPARMTAALLALVVGGLAPGAVRREAQRTPSPNSGWPMAAMALGLGVRLRKPAVYVLNPQGRSPRMADTARAVRLADRAVFLLAFLLGGVVMVWVATR